MELRLILPILPALAASYPLAPAHGLRGGRRPRAHPRYLAALGYSGPSPARAGDVWRHLIGEVARAEPDFAEFQPALDVILDEGCLARRILRATGDAPSRERLREVYGALGACLDQGEMFRSAP